MRPPILHGRDSLLGTLRALVACGERVTLRGPGGVGKTRLAEALLAECGGRFVDLSDLVSVDAARTAIGAPARPLGDPDLLVLDGCDRLCPEAVAWLDASLGTRPVIVTCGHELGWPRERCVEVTPLDLGAASAVFADAARLPRAPDAEFDVVFRHVGGHPGAIRKAAACLDIVDLASLLAWLGGTDEAGVVHPRLFALRESIREVTWQVDAQGAWHAPPGGPHRPIKGTANRRLLACLVALRLSEPGRCAGTAILVGAGWPGDRLSATATGNRVRVALSTLRRAGLATLIERGESGWRLAPSWPVKAVGEATGAPGTE